VTEGRRATIDGPLAGFGLACALVAGCGGGSAGGAPRTANPPPPLPSILFASRTLAEGATATGDTRGRPDARRPSCAGDRGGDGAAGADGAVGADGAGSGDERWEFQPAESGHYRFTVEAEYDAVLAVREAAGGGAAGASPGGDELACNDDAGSKLRSEVVVALTAGRRYEVVVDGFRGAAGRYALRVARGEPPVPPGRQGRLSVGLEVQGTTAGAAHTVTPTCGARDGSGDHVWHFVPAERGAYRFRVDAQYDSVVSVVADGGAELGCNDDTDGERGRSVVVALLEAGRPYGVVVDGYAGETGAYRLLAERVGTGGAGGGTGGTGGPGGGTGGAAVGAGGPLAVATPTRGSTTGAPDTYTPRCGARPGSSDHVWLVTPAQAGLYRGTVRASYDAVLAVLDDQGVEVACNDDASNRNHSEVDVRLEAGRTYRFVVDGYSGAAGDYEITVAVATGPGGGAGGGAGGGGPPRPPVTPQTLQRDGSLTVGRPVNGDTRGGNDQFAPSCARASAGGPDRVYEVRVPRRGLYRAHVLAQYDSVVAVYDQNLVEIGCNDDLRTQSESAVSLRLDPGRPYYVVVDGYQGASGAFLLTFGRAPKPGRIRL
jgi:hypothetical protein